MSFKICDTVIVRFTRNDVFPYQNELGIVAKLSYLPRAEGDSYHFVKDDGQEFTVNPRCPDFVGIWKMEKGEPK